MAQEVEHHLGKVEVPGSNPGISSKQAPSNGCFLSVYIFRFDKFYNLKDSSLISINVVDIDYFGKNSAAMQNFTDTLM